MGHRLFSGHFRRNIAFRLNQRNFSACRQRKAQGCIATIAELRSGDIGIDTITRDGQQKAGRARHCAFAAAGAMSAPTDAVYTYDDSSCVHTLAGRAIEGVIVFEFLPRQQHKRQPARAIKAWEGRQMTASAVTAHTPLPARAMRREGWAP